MPQLRGAVGNFVVTWSSYGQDGSGYGVYAQRYQTDISPVLTTPTSINLTDTAAVDTFSAQMGMLSATPTPRRWIHDLVLPSEFSNAPPGRSWM